MIDDFLVRDQVFFAEVLGLLLDDLGAALVAVLVLDVDRLFLDEEVDLARVGEQVFEVVDLLDQLRVLVLDLAGARARPGGAAACRARPGPGARSGSKGLRHQGFAAPAPRSPAPRIVRMTASRLSIALSRPSRMWRALARLLEVELARRRMTSRRKSM